LHTNLAAIYLKQGAPEKALLQAEKAIRPTQVHSGLSAPGGLYLSTGRRDQAIQTYQTILQIDPKSQEALLFLGTLNAEAKNFDSAISYLKTLLEIDPQSLMGHYYLARIYAETKRLTRLKPITSRPWPSGPNLNQPSWTWPSFMRFSRRMKRPSKS